MTFGLCYPVFGQGFKPVPLKNVVVEASVVDMIAEVTISQTYVNIEDDTIEAIYRFPLHEASAVCSFEAVVDDKKKIKGVIKESKEAAKEYDDAIQEGHGAYLLEQQHPDIFECKVGNITTKQKVLIKIVYVTELKHDSETEKIRFVLPTHIAPRYQPAGFGFGNHHNQNSSYFIGEECFNLSISVTCRMTSVITSIESPSHHIATELNIEGNQKMSRITYEDSAKHMEKDFILIIKSQGLDQPRAFVEYDSVTDTNCVMLTLVPKFAINSVITECIFIIDRSGSMDGEPIRKASQALELFVRSLPEDSYFNVISFGSYHSALFPRSQPNSQSSQSAAINHAQQMRADMAGTEIYKCLEWVFGNTRSDMPTAIFLLTDGSVWNVDEIAELVKKNQESHQDDLHVFTLGIGSSVSHNLIESVARAGKGYSQYVANNERMDKKVIGMLRNAVKPPIKDYKITWTSTELREIGEMVPEKEKPVISFFSDEVSPPPKPFPDDFVENLQLRQAPYEIPQIYQGVRFLVYCILAKGIEPSRSITLSAISQDGPMKLVIPVDPVTLQGSKIHTLAARKLIQDLEDGKSFLHAHPKFEGKNVGISLVKKQIIDLAIKHNITSRYTSFLAIDERGVELVKDSLPPQRRTVPQHFANNLFGSTYNQSYLTQRCNSGVQGSGFGNGQSNYQPSPQQFSQVQSAMSAYSGGFQGPIFRIGQLNSSLQQVQSAQAFGSGSGQLNHQPYMTTFSQVQFGSQSTSTIGAQRQPAFEFMSNNCSGVSRSVSAVLPSAPVNTSLSVFSAPASSITPLRATIASFGSSSSDNRAPTNEGVKEPENSTISDIDLLYKFLRLQSFDGKFLPTEEFYSYFDFGDRSDADCSLREFGIKHNIDEVSWTTSVAIKYLEIVMGEKYQVESEMCREKAEKALKKIIGEGEESEKIMEIAQEWVSKWSLRGNMNVTKAG